MRCQELEVCDFADAAACLDLADQLERATQERPVELCENRLLRRPLPYCEIAIDARVALGRAAVEGNEPVDRALEVVGLEAVERLRLRGRGAEHLSGEPNVEAAVARLLKRVGDREVGDRGREENRAVRLLRPEVAHDVVGRLRVRQVGDQPLDPLARPAVELAQVQRTATADEDPPRREPIGAEVDEGTDRPLRADDGCDQGRVEAVLERDDEAVPS